MSLAALSDLLFFASGLVLGISWPRRPHKRPITIEAQPLPCVLFRRDWDTEDQVAWLRWLADKLEAEHAKDEGGDDDR